jgi:hypothetical protein
LDAQSVSILGQNPSKNAILPPKAAFLLDLDKKDPLFFL